MDRRRTTIGPKAICLNYIVIPQKIIWNAELYLFNAAENIVPIGNDAFKVHVLFDGTAVWYTGGVIKIYFVHQI